MAASNPADVAFSVEQQEALLGHALSDARVFEAAQTFGVDENWFESSPNGGSVWKALATFWSENKRHPNLAELKSEPAFTKEDAKIRQARFAVIDRALSGRVDIGFDSIVSKLREWAKGQKFLSRMVEAEQLWNRHDSAQAYSTVQNLMLDLERIDMQGLYVRCQDAATRAKEERAERVAQAGRLLSYGVEFLDDATGGIGPNDLVLVGAKSGAGKTQLVANIAGTNARAGKRVAMFALEAEPNEIERRLKYALLARAYQASHKGQHAKMIDYASWRHGKLEQELGSFEAGANAMMQQQYSTLKTIYRQGGDYGVGELERDIVRLAPEVDLIILDHLHYVDLDGDNENAAMKAVVKKLRDLALMLGKPIVVVAHMRKSFSSKNAPLLPSLEDFHGSSDIIKIATTAIILGPCWEMPAFNGPAPDMFFEDKARTTAAALWPTYFRIAKYRLEGSRLRFSAIAWFDTKLGTYRKNYALGELVSGECHWRPIEKRPHWAQHATVSLMSTNS
jgi:hypothetical protein